MGIYSDLLSLTKDIDTDDSDGIIALDRAVRRELADLQSKGDRAYPTAYAVRNEVQEIAEFVEDGTLSGDFDLTVTLKDGTTCTVVDIAFDASAATIQTALDSAADSVLTGYVAGDITVGGGPMDTAPLTLTFDGDSVAGQNHPLATTDIGDIVDAAAGGGDVSVTTEGQTNRTAWAILQAVGALIPDAPENGDNPLPDQGDTPVDLVASSNRGTNDKLPSEPFLRAMAREAAREDGNDAVETAILAALGY